MPGVGFRVRDRSVNHDKGRHSGARNCSVEPGQRQLPKEYDSSICAEIQGTYWSYIRRWGKIEIALRRRGDGSIDLAIQIL